jgi:hypothetical protein
MSPGWELTDTTGLAEMEVREMEGPQARRHSAV